jgi:hypothetical protein
MALFRQGVSYWAPIAKLPWPVGAAVARLRGVQLVPPGQFSLIFMTSQRRAN